MGIVRQRLGVRGAEGRFCRDDGTLAGADSGSDAAAFRLRSTSKLCLCGISGDMAAPSHPAPADAWARFDGWIMRHPPMAARAISGFDRG